MQNVLLNFKYVFAVRFYFLILFFVNVVISNTFLLYDFIFWFYFLSMSMSSDWCMKFSETFFLFLVLTFSEDETTFDFSINRYEIHVKLIHINYCWIETIIYRVILNEMFVCNFSIHVCMSKFCQDVLRIIFCNLRFNVCLWFDFIHVFSFFALFD